MTSVRISTPSASSSLETVNGGASRSAVGVTPFTTRPASRHARATSGAVRPASNSGCSSAASSRPRPLTPATPGTLSSSAVSSAPRSRASRGASISSMIRSTSRAAEAASGWPAKVDPWSPGPNADATSDVAHTAPMGTPFPRALATVTMSARIPAWWNPNQAPVRPRPVWISSMTSRMPRSSQSRRTPLRNSTSAGLTPPSPWRGSSRIAPTDGSMAASKAATSFQAACRKPSGSGWKGSCFSGWPVAARVARVRP